VFLENFKERIEINKRECLFFHILPQRRGIRKPNGCRVHKVESNSDDAKLLAKRAAFHLGDCGRGVSTAAARIARIADVADGVSQPLSCKIQERRIAITLNGLDLSARASAS
jgi:hypothetical protein